jgi:hypothetical protein
MVALPIEQACSMTSAAEYVFADVARADGQVGDFGSTNAIHVQALIDDTASLAWLHRASAELSWRSPKGRRGRDEETHVSQGTNYHLDHVRREYVCSPHARSCLLFSFRDHLCSTRTPCARIRL